MAKFLKRQLGNNNYSYLKLRQKFNDFPEGTVFLEIKSKDQEKSIVYRSASSLSRPNTKAYEQRMLTEIYKFIGTLDNPEH